MKKLLLIFFVSFFSLHAKAETTPLQRFLLINDLETWLNGGQSLLDWSSFRKGKKINVSPDGYSLVKIYYDFKRNIFAAEKEYTGVIQRTKMPFSSVEKNDRGEPILVFDVGYGSHIYANGVTIREAEKLKIGTALDLLCVNFKLDKYDDMSATCSLFESASRAVAINNIQNGDETGSIEPIIKKLESEIIYKKLNTIFKKESTDEFNIKCSFIDTTNYALCTKLLTNMHENVKGSELKENKAPS